MSRTTAPLWRATGLAWAETGARMEWLSATGEVRAGEIELGAELGLVVGPDRRCVGVWAAGRRIPCATNTSLDPAATSGQCASCAAMARSRSVATDTQLDDPREFSVYLAHHGSVVKAGITATERGRTRLLEQGALAAAFLSAGSLLSARRCESLLTAALGLPQQVRTARKREARRSPGTAEQRGGELSDVVARAHALDWPDGQTLRDPSPFDLTDTYGLPPDGVRPGHAVAPLSPGQVITGTVICRIGRDLYLATPAGLVLLDTGLLQGWTLARPDDRTGVTATLTPIATHEEIAPDALF
ncbi:DUF2797 domain-containing protein [Myceligenerans crystallogenes]|uniref:DUF2797 domain-containing protein n=1 Tax=Myceligenerans crystallogenes TaxID=316335 RepID=A0ABP4ZSN7_9MICO